MSEPKKQITYSIFGETKIVWATLHNMTVDEEPEEVLWVERPEDWYALSSPQLRDKKVAVVSRDEWLMTSNTIVAVEKAKIHHHKTGVHVSHCCIHHGCKYGDTDCPVETGRSQQAYPCERCDGRIFKIEQALKAFVSEFESNLVLDDVIVDSPEDRWSRLEKLYKAAKEALETQNDY